MNEIDRILQKCMSDALAPCQATCPLHVDAKGYIQLISEGKFAEALQLIGERLPFPGIMGRVCSHPCEPECRRGDKGEPIAICALKRFAADHGNDNEWRMEVLEEKRQKVAIVGGGPAGIMAAYKLRKMGYQVTIFEALPFLGGMLRVGIPSFRLPRDILQKELGIIERLGVEIKLSTPIGLHITIANLRRDFNAVFLAIGAHMSTKLSVPGEELLGMHRALDFLREVNLGGKVDVGHRVIVVGGGNAAIDAALVVRRLGAEEVSILYRRSRAEMPASEEEIETAESENIKIHYLASPVRIIGKDGKVSCVECVRTKLGAPDETGRKSPIPIENAGFLLEGDTVICAIGQYPDISFLDKHKRLTLGQGGTIEVDPVTLQTNIEGIFAGGDAVTGASTVIGALDAGRRAATSIDRYMKGENIGLGRESEGSSRSQLKVDIGSVVEKQRVKMPTLSLNRRTSNFDEIELGFTEDQAKEEAKRCLSCECRLCMRECEFLNKVGQIPKELAERLKAGYFREKPQIPYSCNLCNLCEEICPEKLNIGKMCLELRQQLVEEKLGPLPAHKFVAKDQEFVRSDAFTLSLPDRNGDCQRVFFPGCSLSGYSPSVVVKTYDYLCDRFPGTGILLKCCGAPSHNLGQNSLFQESLNGIETAMKKLGATEMIVACPDCYRTLKHYAPQLQPRSLYEVMLKIGLPKIAKRCERTFSLHDSCTARWEKDLQDSVRALASNIGCAIGEMEYSRDRTRCCGMGGMIIYADFDLANSLIKRRTEEAPFDMLTYCASCREAFALYKPSLHLLDLIFNPDWEKDRLKPPNKASIRRENQSLLKSQLEKKG